MAASATASHGSSRLRRCIIAIEGVVQGIGFRPAIYRLAVRHGLGGSVRNSLQGVLVDVEGDATVIASFVAELDALAPGNRRRASITWQEPRGRASAFTVDASLRSGTAELSPTPDRATCEDCLAELMRPGDHRHGYALLTCSVCGPRFTIVRALPYDRERTTMAGFALCARCRREYETPSDRRFHAETIACPRCGPLLAVRGADGAPVAAADPIRTAAAALRDGGIVGLKGIGGYHLACDATNAAAIVELRRRKRREAKPLAVMVKDLTAARALCRVSDAEARLLASPARPIVLLTKRADATIAVTELHTTLKGRPDGKELANRLGEILDPTEVFASEAAPTGAAAKLSLPARSVIEGLDALNELMNEPTVQAAVVAFQTDFQAACEQMFFQRFLQIKAAVVRANRKIGDGGCGCAVRRGYHFVLFHKFQKRGDALFDLIAAMHIDFIRAADGIADVFLERLKSVVKLAQQKSFFRRRRIQKRNRVHMRMGHSKNIIRLPHQIRSQRAAALVGNINAQFTHRRDGMLRRRLSVNRAKSGG